MRYCEECDPETYDEMHHCPGCQWEGWPIIAGSSTSVPYGSTWAVLEDFELLCPMCNKEALEGELPYVEEEEE